MVLFAPAAESAPIAPTKKYWYSSLLVPGVLDTYLPKLGTWSADEPPRYGLANDDAADSPPSACGDDVVLRGALQTAAAGRETRQRGAVERASARDAVERGAIGVCTE
jgi:hypothetical protein